MEYQRLFSPTINLSSAEFAHRVAKVYYKTNKNKMIYNKNDI